MVEPIEELKRICRPTHEEDLLDVFERRRSIYLTWLLLHTPITANQTTILSAVFGITGALLLAIGSYWWAIVGALCLQMCLALDFVDGEIARYKKAVPYLVLFWTWRLIR